MGNEFFHPQWDAVPMNAIEIEATGVQDKPVLADRLKIEIFFDHQNCPNANVWRAEGGEGFPRFKAVLHERYNRNKTFLECEGCRTVISHSISCATGTEST